MKRVPIPFPVAGILDTANPITNRPIGTLVETLDAAHRWIGSRRCFTQKTWAYQAPADYPNPHVPVFDGSLMHGISTMRTVRQYNLPTSWTLDTVFRPSGVSHSADTDLLIFQWDLNGIEAIGLYIKGGGAAAGTQRKLKAVITPTSAAGVAGTAATLNGTTQLTVGTTVDKTHHVRLVRDGANLTLLADGVVEDTKTNFSATQRHEAATGVAVTCRALLAGTSTGGNHLFAGRLYRTLLRSGAASDVTKGMRDFSFPYTKGVRFAQRGTTGTSPDLEYSPFRNGIVWTSLSDELETNPTPWAMNNIQAGTYHVDIRGRAWNVVAVGGYLYWRRVG